MPIYEYECDDCHEVFEVRQKMSDPPPAGHACGSQRVHRVLSATTFVLKGTGWYKTDYADKSRPSGDGEAKDKTPAKAAAKADAGSNDTGSGKTDGKKAAADKAPAASPSSSGGGADKGSAPAA